MCDQREKVLVHNQWDLGHARQQGYKEGFALGRKEEAYKKNLDRGILMGCINTFQWYLGEPESTDDELNKLYMIDLNRLCAELRDRIRTRGG